MAFCGISHPELLDEAMVTGPVAYYRFHGAPDLYRSFYSDEALAGLKQISNQNSFVNIIYKLQCLK